MHLNYHFLRFLAPELSNTFRGNRILSCFSQSKDELIIETRGNSESLFIRAHFLPPEVYLCFPGQFHRAKRNSIDLFGEILGDIIQSCRVFTFERALLFDLLSGKKLILKLHGNRSNVLLYESEETVPKLLFRNDIKEDKSLDWRTLDRSLDLSWENFELLLGNASQFIPTLGTIPRTWLKDRHYPEVDLPEKWTLMQELLDLLEAPLFSLVEKEGDIVLSLLPEPTAINQFSDPIEAINELFYKALVLGNFEKEKKQLQKGFQEKLKKTISYLTKTKDKLDELTASSPPSQLADVIMANLHRFPSTGGEIQLENFYTGDSVSVKLKTNQKPQDLAESLYRKSKNRQLEIDQLDRSILAKMVLEKELKNKLLELEEIQDFKGLKNFLKSNKEEVKDKKNPESLPFKVFEFDGYTIWIGKSAKDNDEMLRNFIHKDDIWLHARMAAGSHVVIRMKGMPVLPQQVLERAAGLAAFYSKLKTDSLAPVIYTESKYVRKVKGSAPGSVVVDKEKVILVPPKGPDQDTAAGR